LQVVEVEVHPIMLPLGQVVAEELVDLDPVYQALHQEAVLLLKVKLLWFAVQHTQLQSVAAVQVDRVHLDQVDSQRFVVIIVLSLEVV
jgi:hypothetical protein